MDLELLSIEEINAEMEKVEAARREAKERGREIKKVLERKLADEQYDIWGLSPEEYAAAKAEAKEKGEPAHVGLNRARSRLLKAMRQAQTGRTTPAAVGVHGKDV